MDKTLFDHIVSLLEPEMSDIANRQALVQSALFGSPVVNQINWSGAAHVFTVQLVTRLYRYDTSALIAVLRELQSQVGASRQAAIAELIHALTATPSAPKGQDMTMDPSILVGFLFEVGRWAKSELKERWEVRREQQSADLTKKAEVEQAVPAMLQAAASASSPRRVQETIDLIERKRDAIDRARNAKLADREQLDRQELLQASFEQLEKKHNRTIKQMLDEIAADLNDLGFDVERSKA
jgi:hypothetical protein